jgi:hypothetical protein
MFTAHEIFGFMSPALGLEIIEQTQATDKETYHTVLSAVAEARKVRPVFLERKSRGERHQEILATLSKPRLDLAALTLLQSWLLKIQAAMLADFLNALDIKHERGVVDSLPEKMDDEKLKAAVDGLLARYPREKVAVYLRAFSDLSEARWPNLTTMLDQDARLQLGAA